MKFEVLWQSEKGPGEEGVDIIAEEKIFSRTGHFLKSLIWYVQCKHSLSRSVQQGDISDFMMTVAVPLRKFIENCKGKEVHGYLLITDAQVAISVQKALANAYESKKWPYKAGYWDYDKLSREIRTHPSILKRYFPEEWGRTQFSTSMLFNLKRRLWSSNLPDIKSTRRNKLIIAKNFYTGNTTLDAITLGLDAKRFVYVNGQKLSYNRFFKEKILPFIDRSEPKISFVLITGAGWSGKTTLLYRMGCDLYTLLLRKDSTRKLSMLLYSPGERFVVDELEEFYNYCRKPLFILSDVEETKRVVNELRVLVKSLSTPSNGIPIVIFAAAKKNDWDNAPGSNFLRVAVDNFIEVQLKEITPSVFDEIFTLLKDNQQLESFGEEDIRKFLDIPSNKKFLSPLILLKSKKSKDLETSVIEEYNTLPKRAATAYLYICLLFTYSIPVPESLFLKLTSYMNLMDLLGEIVIPARDVIVMERTRVGIKFRARNPYFAEVVVKRVKIMQDEDYKLVMVKNIINEVELTNRSERYVVIKLFRGLLLKFSDHLEMKYNRNIVKSLFSDKSSQIRIDHLINEAYREGKIAELVEWAYLYTILGDSKNSQKCLQLAYSISSQNPNLLYYLAKTKIDQLKKSDYPLSKSKIEEIEDLLHKAYLNGNKTIEFFLVYGSFEAKIGKLDEAVRLFTEALILKPNNKIICYAYSDILRQLKKNMDYNQLIALCRLGLEVDPNNPQTILALANALEMKGEDKKALAMYKKIMKLKPDYKAALERSAFLSDKLGNKEQAEGYYRHYMKVYKEKDLLAAKIRNDLAILLSGIDAKYYKEAKSLWKEAIEIWPDFVWAYIELSNFYLKKTHQVKSARKYALKGLVVAKKKSILNAISKAEQILEEIEKLKN